MNRDAQNASERERIFTLSYRGDIQGLRALAVLLVIGAHGGLPGLSGGFIGVDVFFVISGYVITGLLLRDIAKTGRIGFLDFYARRLRRLLPALLFMLTLVGIAAGLLLAPFEQHQHAESALYATVWLSNMYFALSRLNYFDAGADENLFLHTWSLGLEEQFYLLWPLLLMFLLRQWRGQSRSADHATLLKGMAATIVIGLLFSLFLSVTKPLWGFYFMPSRIWQFALGALILIWAGDRNSASPCAKRIGSQRNEKWILHVVGWIGLGLIVGPAIFIDRNVMYPGYWAILPSVGTALLLFVGTWQQDGAIRLLSLPPMQGIGNISYSWYLWHWPTLVIGVTIFRYKELGDKITLVLISLLLAVVAYYLVERPMRFHKKLSARPTLTYALSAALMAGASFAAVSWQSSSGDWAASAEQRQFTDSYADLPVIYSMGCDDWYHSDQLKACLFGSEQASHTAVLIGDSVLAQWFPALAKIYTHNDWRLIVITKSSCPMVDEPFFYQRIGRRFVECETWRDSALDWLKSNKPDLVFMGTTHAPFTEAQWRGGTVRVLQRFAAQVPQVFIIRPTYTLPFNGPACLARQKWQAQHLPLEDACSSPAGNARQIDIFNWLSQAANEFDNVSVLDMNAVVCPNAVCSASNGGKVVYRDDQHLAASYVESLSEAFREKAQ